MWKPILVWLYVCGYCAAGPYGGKRNMPIIQREEEPISAATENEVNKPEAAGADDETAVAPNMPMLSTLMLPSNATSIRADITDGFSCANKSYGYYADVENECQIFHVCLPVTYADGKETTFRWSFICPEETIFSQDSFTCMRREDMTIDCEESFRYYELNRNFGMIDEDNSKTTQNIDSAEHHVITETEKEDQIPAMTQYLEEEEPQKQQQQNLQPLKPVQTLSDEKVMKPPASLAATTAPQKQKPAKAPKPNRRKPAYTLAQKKKPLRKTPSVTAAPNIEPITLVSTLAEEIEETKPTFPSRFTKRPTITNNLKEKLQQAKPTDTIPIRIELYNQKRKRPVFFNKKDATTIKPTEEQATSTDQHTALELDSTKAPQTLADATPIENLKFTSEIVTPQASETSSVFVKPEEPVAVDLSENKKVSKPQPTEPEAIVSPAVGNLEEMPAIRPIEAFEEIPAVIAEVEETNSNAQPTAADQKTAVDILQPLPLPVASIEEEHVADEKLTVQAPNIFQQNSEEVLPAAPSIEEMEDEKPVDAPEMIIASPEMEHQHPMIEEMFGEADKENNKQTIGGLKPVDPAMAAEAEALIANFLNTLMKSDQANATPAATADIDNSQILDEKESSTDNLTSEETKTHNSDTEHQSEETEQHATAAVHPQLPTDNDELLPSIMMMHNQPGDVFQIPVQLIQTPIEELTTATNPAAKPLSVDDVVELVKEQLDQKSPSEKETPELSIENKFQKLGEELIMPIYHRDSVEPNQNTFKEPSEQTNETATVESVKIAENAENTMETIETENKEIKTAAVQARAKAKNGRSQRAHSIKTVSNMMDPRKRRFLFRSDAS